MLSLQQLRVDVGDQLEIDSENSNSELIPLTPQDTEEEQKDSTLKLDKETQRLQEARKLMNASGQLLSKLSKEGLTEEQKPRRKAITTHQSKEEFDKIMPGDSRWNKVLTVMKGIQLGAARSQGEASTKLRKFDFFTKDEYRLEAFSASSASNPSDVVVPLRTLHLEIFTHFEESGVSQQMITSTRWDTRVCIESYFSEVSRLLAVHPQKLQEEVSSTSRRTKSI